MEINSLIKILKGKLKKNFTINNLEIEDKSFLHKKHKIITVHIRNVKVPLIILFRALGIESDKDIINHVILDKNIKNYKNILNKITE